MSKTLLGAAALTGFMTIAGASAHAAETPFNPRPQGAPGACYADKRFPAVYAPSTREIIVQDASVQPVVSQAQFRSVKRQVLVRAPAVEYVARAPVYETRDISIMTRPGYERLVVEPASYETVTETVVTRPAEQVWREGELPGAVARRRHPVSHITYSLFETPAETMTVERRTATKPAQVKTIFEEPVYQTVSTQVMVEAGRIEQRHTPAMFETVEIHEFIAPGELSYNQTSAETRSVDVEVLLEPARHEWVEVLCEHEATPALVARLQSVLRVRGMYEGEIDGVFGPKTARAIARFQEQNGIAHYGNLTMAAVNMLEKDASVLVGVDPALAGGANERETTVATRSSDVPAELRGSRRRSAVSVFMRMRRR